MILYDRTDVFPANIESFHRGAAMAIVEKI
jgi:hypothetical protein